MHFLQVSWSPDDLPMFNDINLGGHFSLEGNFFATFPDRLKLAWEVLWKRHADTNVGVLLTRENAQKLITVLQNYLGDLAAAERRNDKA